MTRYGFNSARGQVGGGRRRRGNQPRVALDTALTLFEESEATLGVGDDRLVHGNFAEAVRQTFVNPVRTLSKAFQDIIEMGDKLRVPLEKCRTALRLREPLVRIVFQEIGRIRTAPTRIRRPSTGNQKRLIYAASLKSVSSRA